MTIDLSKVTPELITAAIKIADVDEAFCSMMGPAGITDGGIADMAFERDDWASGGEAKRREMISDWLELEKVYLPEDPVEKATTAIERAIVSARPSSPTFPEVLEMLDNVSAIAENTILHYHPMNAERTIRLDKVKEARDLCDRLLRPAEVNEALFKIFQMTRRYCDDLGKALQDSMWDESGHKGIGFLYAGTYYIEIQQDWWPEEAKEKGRYHLIVERDDSITNDLESLERELFAFACINDLTFEEAMDDLTVDLFEGESGNAGEQHQRQHISRGELREIIKENQDSMEADEVATMRKALVENGTYRIFGFVGCWWDVVLVKPAAPAMFPPENATALIEMARGARCTDTEWGSEEQIERFNAFTTAASKMMTAEQSARWDAFSMKANNNEIVDEALKILGVVEG